MTSRWAAIGDDRIPDAAGESLTVQQHQRLTPSETVMGEAGSDAGRRPDRDRLGGQGHSRDALAKVMPSPYPNRVSGTAPRSATPTPGLANSHGSGGAATPDTAVGSVSGAVTPRAQPGRGRAPRSATAERGAFSSLLRWSGDGAHVGQVGGRLVVRRGVGVDDGAQEQSALQPYQPRGQRREVAEALPRIEHGARRDIPRRLRDLGDQLSGAGLVEPGWPGGTLRTLHAGQTSRAGGTGRALHALRALQAGETRCALLAALALLALGAGQALLTLFPGLADHPARALGAGQALLALWSGLTPLAGQPARAGLTAQSGQALWALLARATGGTGQTLLALRTGLTLRPLLANGALLALLALVAPLADGTDRALGTLVAGLTGGAGRAGRALRAAIALLDGDIDGNLNGLPRCGALRLCHSGNYLSYKSYTWVMWRAASLNRPPLVRHPSRLL